jgi:hypothetical protein
MPNPESGGSKHGPAAERLGPGGQRCVGAWKTRPLAAGIRCPRSCFFSLRRPFHARPRILPHNSAGRARLVRPGYVPLRLKVEERCRPAAHVDEKPSAAGAKGGVRACGPSSADSLTKGDSDTMGKARPWSAVFDRVQRVASSWDWGLSGWGALLLLGGCGPAAIMCEAQGRDTEVSGVADLPTPRRCSARCSPATFLKDLAHPPSLDRTNILCQA